MPGEPNASPFPYHPDYASLFVRGDDNALWHIWQTAPAGG
jgi:hypothetical protein